MRLKKILAVCCILMGIVMAAIPIGLHFLGEKQADELIEEFEQEVDSDVSPKEETSDKETETLPEGENVIGIIEIKSIGIRYPVIEGTSNEVLNSGIGHMTDTADIGEAGNCVLCGHNGSRHGTFFTPLNRVSLGDTVKVVNRKGENHMYEITGTKIVQPTDNTIKEDDGTEKLTLFTCANRGTMRFVCFCEPIGDVYD